MRAPSNAPTPRSTAMNKRQFLVAMPALALAGTGCGDPRDHANAVYMLVDTSATYAQESGKAQVIISSLWGARDPGAVFSGARVTSRRFNEKDIVAKATF